MGFTLIEVIVIIIIVSISATLFITYMRTAYTNSPISTGLVKKQHRLIEQMELLTHAYRQALDGATEETPVDLCAFKESHVDNLQIDGKSIVDAANTSCTFSLTGVTKNVLIVTLTDGQQILQSIFTN
jgi:type II secretory pathway component PulJ